MLEAYRHNVAERAALGIPPLPLTAQQTAEVIELLKAPPAGEEEFLVELLSQRVPAGVDDAAKVKASYLAAVAFGTEKTALISPTRATELLGTMLGGYNIQPLIDLLDNAELGATAAEALKHTLLVFDAFHDVQEKAEAGNAHATSVLQSWADAEWFTSKPQVPQSPDRHRVQGAGRNQHRRPVAGSGCHHPPGHPAARAGDAEEQARWRGVRAGRRRQARPDPGHCRSQGQGPSGRVCGRRGRYRFLAQVGHQLGAVVDWRRYSVHPEQALRRCVPG